MSDGTIDPKDFSGLQAKGPGGEIHVVPMQMTREEADARIAAAKVARARRAFEAVPLPVPATCLREMLLWGGTYYAATDNGAYVLNRDEMRWEKLELIPPEATPLN